MTIEEVTIKSLQESLLNATMEIERLNNLLKLPKNVRDYSGMISRKEESRKEESRKEVFCQKLPNGVEIDDRPCEDYDVTKYRRLHFGEAVPAPYTVWSHNKGPWKKLYDKHITDYVFDRTVHPIIVPITHPITPFKNE
jgi:hypothetical protein